MEGGGVGMGVGEVEVLFGFEVKRDVGSWRG
jgi:hypothetical protein